MNSGANTGPVAVVTGAGSGIGRAICRAMLAAGYRVALAGRRPEPLQETAAGSPADSFLVIAADVGREADVAGLFETVESRWGRVDVLVNNAGSSGRAGAVDELSPADFTFIVQVNLIGAFLCAHHAVALMKRQSPGGGRIINNGSISAHSPRPRSVAYTATKHAITGLTKSISLDGRNHRIACGQIDIGNAATEMTDQISRGVAQADGSIAPEPTFEVRHIADAVLYMAALPLEANVQFLTVMATTMPFIGRG